MTQEKQATDEAEAKQQQIANSVIMQEGDNSKKPVFDDMVKNFSQLAFTTAPGANLALYPQSSDEDESQEGDG